MKPRALSIHCLLLLLLALALSGCGYMPRRLAIMDFENDTSESRYDFLSAALPEYLSASLANSRAIRLLERQDIHRYLNEIDSDPSDTRRLSRWQKLGERIGAEYLVAGSVSRLDRNFIITTRLFSVDKGEVVLGSAVTQACVNEYEIYHIAQTIARYLAYQLRPHGLSPAQSQAPPPAFSPSPAEQPQLPVANEPTR